MTDVRDQTYLSRINCEYRDYLIELCGEFGVGFHRGFRSEREDWIMTMVAAGMGIRFLNIQPSIPGSAIVSWQTRELCERCQ